MELRVFAEFAKTLALQPLLRSSGKGQGQPVIIAPAFMLADGGSAYLRRLLNKMGFASYGWTQGRNSGIDQRKLDGFLAHIDEIAEKHQQKVTLVGWSLGGIYARAAAAVRNDNVKQIITLGSPFNAPTMDEDAVSGAVLKLYEFVNTGGPEDPMLDLKDRWQATPDVPSTAIYSEGDGIAHWHYCVDEPKGQTENIRVKGSHLGLTHNAAVIYALVNRLIQEDEHWQAMDVSTFMHKPFYANPTDEQLQSACFPAA
jgi:pimeloyl-ACP methyl ester carboxylesterase